MYHAGQQQGASERVHSSMYANLRTNLPREVMSYTDFPFTQSWGDPRRFCGHNEVFPLALCSTDPTPTSSKPLHALTCVF